MRRATFAGALWGLFGATACGGERDAGTSTPRSMADSSVVFAACSAARLAPVREALDAGKEPKLTVDNVSRGALRRFLSRCGSVDTSRVNVYEIQFVLPEAALALWGDSLGGGLVRVYSRGAGTGHPPGLPSPRGPADGS